jgi:hypothetical protein
VSSSLPSQGIRGRLDTAIWQLRRLETLYVLRAVYADRPRPREVICGAVRHVATLPLSSYRLLLYSFRMLCFMDTNACVMPTTLPTPPCCRFADAVT